MSRTGARQPFRRPQIHLLTTRKMRPGHCRATDTAGDDCAAYIQTSRRSSTQSRVDPGNLHTPPSSHINRDSWLLLMVIQQGNYVGRLLQLSAMHRRSGVPASPKRSLLKQSSSVGYLCRSLPFYVQKPPIEAVVFGWGVNEDGQLVSTCPLIIVIHAALRLAAWLASCNTSRACDQRASLVMTWRPGQVKG